jgi:hypothetical protein
VKKVRETGYATDRGEACFTPTVLAWTLLTRKPLALLFALTEKVAADKIR